MYNPPGKVEQRRQADKQEASRVLLVCIYDTIALEVTNQLVYEKFSKYGPIIKVLIFEKGEVTKLFVEYNEQPSAQQAKAALDGTKLLGAICKMNIYFSNFSNVDLKNETTEGADFTIMEEMRNEYMRKFDQMSRSYQSEQQDFFNDQSMMDAAFSPFGARSKTDNPRQLQEQIQKANMQQYQVQVQPLHPMIREQDQVEHMIHNGINNLLGNNSNHSNSPENKPAVTQTTSHSQASTERINPTLRIKESEPANSSILRFQLKKDVTLKCIYNLFSNFGNISFISKKHGRAYIKFRTIQFAAIARTYLNERFMMGNVLVLVYPDTAQEGYPQEGEYCESMFYDASYDRFTPNRSLTVNSPSQTLHVSSLKKDVCRENTLYKIFSQFGKVEAVKILCYSNEKNMALVKFYFIEDSFQAISNLHNEVFSGRKMQISFTKSRV